MTGVPPGTGRPTEGTWDHPVHLDTGARALDALDAAEAAEFDVHLVGCVACRTELAEFHATAAALAAAVSAVPPDAVRTRVMGRVRQLPQLPPIGDLPGSPGLPPPATAPAIGTVRRSRAWYRSPAALLTAAALVVVMVVGAVVLAARPAPQSADAAMAQCVATAPDAQMMKPAPGSGGDVMMAHSCHAAVVRVAGLPALPADQTYQLWVMAPSGARSVGMLGPAPAAAHPMVAALRDGDSGIGVSVEPASGSPAPSSAPVWMVHLDA